MSNNITTTRICPVCDSEVICHYSIILHHQVWKDSGNKYQTNGYVTCPGSGRVLTLEKK